MTASFSLRLRLKVYSLNCAFRLAPSYTLLLQRPTVSEGIPSAAGSPSALAPEGLSARLHTNGLGWPGDGCCTTPAHHIRPLQARRFFTAITLRWIVCPRGRQRPSWRTHRPCAGTDPCSKQAWPCSEHRSVQPGYLAAFHCRTSGGQLCCARYRPCPHGTAPVHPS